VAVSVNQWSLPQTSVVRGGRLAQRAAYVIFSDPIEPADARSFAGGSGFLIEDIFCGMNSNDIFGGLGFDHGRSGLLD
jgi:hypothetical protein